MCWGFIPTPLAAALSTLDRSSAFSILVLLNEQTGSVGCNSLRSANSRRRAAPRTGQTRSWPERVRDRDVPCPC
ncbi:hypothetical protein PR002_g13641 [Phytophthora rubi]|uniref:Secreted protein n=1 Tax=Phytophthora rubi TaxID=129364 RepID=A0A6A3LK28_9STRA|nr:hypothetical protein PR002_g13641 [Phytophthora rubi]